MLSALIFIIAFIVFGYILLQSSQKPKNYPPGPKWLPFIGSAIFWRKALVDNKGYLHKAIENSSKKFGDPNILGLKIGRERLILVGGYEFVSKVLTREEFQERPLDSFFLKMRCLGTIHGITGTQGPEWASQRSFAVRQFKKLEYSGRDLDQKVFEETQFLVTQKDLLHKDIGRTLSLAVANVLWKMTSGNRLEYSDQRLQTILDLLKNRNSIFHIHGGLLNEMPWIRFIFPKWSGYNIILDLNERMRVLIKNVIDEHVATYKVDQTRDYIDAFLHEMGKDRKETPNYFHMGQLIVVCLDFFFAGTQTTSTGLEHFFLMMILYPEVQTKIQEEMDLVIGRDRNPQMSDRPNLPYTQAVMMEIQRYCTHIPVVGPRRATRDTKLGEYFIPKDSTVLYSLYSVHYDKDIWKDPEVFRPGRFLTEDGRVMQTDKIVTFAMGPRRCVGEAIARDCYFLFFTNLLHRYRFEKSPLDKDLKYDVLAGLILRPKHYHPQLVPRA